MLVGVAVLWFTRNSGSSETNTVTCGDGPRETIAIADFVAEYSPHTAQFEGRVGDGKQLPVEREPSLLRSLAGSARQSSEFSEFLIAKYNRCVISQKQFVELSEHVREADALVEHAGFVEKPIE